MAGVGLGTSYNFLLLPEAAQVSRSMGEKYGGVLESNLLVTFSGNWVFVKMFIRENAYFDEFVKGG